LEKGGVVIVLIVAMSSPNGWECIGAFTQALINPNLNPSGTEILTAVVGFGPTLVREVEMILVMLETGEH
jgi:allophanate hydrolase subunit 1